MGRGITRSEYNQNQIRLGGPSDDQQYQGEIVPVSGLDLEDIRPKIGPRPAKLASLPKTPVPATTQQTQPEGHSQTVSVPSFSADAKASKVANQNMKQTSGGSNSTTRASSSATQRRGEKTRKAKVEGKGERKGERKGKSKATAHRDSSLAAEAREGGDPSRSNIVSPSASKPADDSTPTRSAKARNAGASHPTQKKQRSSSIIGNDAEHDRIIRTDASHGQIALPSAASFGDSRRQNAPSSRRSSLSASRSGPAQKTTPLLRYLAGVRRE